MLAASLPLPPSDFSFHAKALESRMEAAAEALLRVRDEVISALDRQVGEIQQLHRALASPPPPMVVVEDTPASTSQPPPSIVGLAGMDRAVFFEQAPAFAPAPTGTLKSIIQASPPVVDSPAPCFAPVIAAAPAPSSESLAPAPVNALPATSLLDVVADASVPAALSGVSPSEPNLDPFLERATLEELNDALASAFAMVSSRSLR